MMQLGPELSRRNASTFQLNAVSLSTDILTALGDPFERLEGIQFGLSKVQIACCSECQQLLYDIPALRNPAGCN